MAEDYTIWSNAGPELRSKVHNAALRLYKMTLSNGKGTGDYQGPLPRLFQNEQNLDWAIWELLVSLTDAGYDKRPNNNNNGGNAT